MLQTMDSNYFNSVRDKKFFGSVKNLYVHYIGHCHASNVGFGDWRRKNNFYS